MEKSKFLALTRNRKNNSFYRHYPKAHFVCEKRSEIMLKKRILSLGILTAFLTGMAVFPTSIASAAPLGTDKPTMWPQTALTQTTAP